MAALHGCAWDTEEDLRPGEPDSDACATSDLTYAAVRPLIETHCLGCHAAASSGGGVLLRDYPQVKAQADRGALVGSVSREGLFAPMPPTYSLETCQIDTIKAWVEAGSPR